MTRLVFGRLSEPSILVLGRGGEILVSATLLQEGEEKVMADRLRLILGAGGTG